MKKTVKDLFSMLKKGSQKKYKRKNNYIKENKIMIKHF